MNYVKTGEKPYLCNCSKFALATHGFLLKGASSRLQALLIPVGELIN